MGRTQVDQSPAPDYSQMQSESETQPEEYQHGLENGTTGTPDEPYYNHENQQANYQAQPSNQPGNDPTMQATQQQFQPPPPPPSYPQYPPQNPQTNPAYQNPPVLYPPPNPQTFPDNRTQPGQYPQQNLQPNPMYMGQPPSRSPPPPQVNDIPQHFSQAGYYPTDQPVQFPPVDAQTYPPMPRPPYKPPVQPISATGIPIPGGWTTGLFDCMDDPTNALTTAFFPCLTFGQVAEIVEDGHTTCGTSGLLYGGIAFLIGLPCLLSCTYRTKMRAKYKLVEVPGPDWVTHFLCEWCALCQEYRELKNRGFDPSIGWLGNVSLMNQQQQQQAATMPPTMDRMMRS